jgi:hypothetical protein
MRFVTWRSLHHDGFDFHGDGSIHSFVMVFPEVQPLYLRVEYCYIDLIIHNGYVVQIDLVPRSDRIQFSVNYEEGLVNLHHILSLNKNRQVMPVWVDSIEVHSR